MSTDRVDSLCGDGGDGDISGSSGGSADHVARTSHGDCMSTDRVDSLRGDGGDSDTSVAAAAPWLTTSLAPATVVVCRPTESTACVATVATVTHQWQQRHTG